MWISALLIFLDEACAVSEQFKSELFIPVHPMEKAVYLNETRA